MDFLRAQARRLRWLAGRGWSAADFEARYGSGRSDAWGYRESPEHRRRAEFILAALPEDRFEAALEVGCAQGFLTERLAPRAQKLVACDLNRHAVERARETCRAFPHVDLRVADIRDGFPGEGFDFCLFSDVLYYLSARENDAVLAEAGRKIRPGGRVVIVSEWSPNASGLTPPQVSFDILDASPLWRQLDRRSTPFGAGDLSLGLYQRLPA